MIQILDISSKCWLPKLALRRGELVLCVALCILGSGVSAHAKATFTTFDPSGSVGTYADSINDTGSIAGYYYDTSGKYHGFVRAADGTITPFDPSGSRETEAQSINGTGLIAGYYYDVNGAVHGFVRAADGTITAFDPSGS